MIVPEKIWLTRGRTGSSFKVSLWACVFVVATSCSGGDDDNALNKLTGGSLGDSLSNVAGDLKGFFVAPIRDSVIATADGYKTASPSSSQSDPLQSFVDWQTSSVSSASTSTSIGKQNVTIEAGLNYDLSKEDLQDCTSYESLIDSAASTERFQNVDSVLVLSDAFSWTSDRTISLSFPGEYAYLSSFFYGCEFESAVKDIDLTTVDEKEKTFVISEKEGEYIKATLSVDDSFVKGKTLQTLNLTEATVPSFDEPWPDEFNELRFSRAFQSSALDEDDQGDDLQMSVTHRVTLEPTMSKVTGNIKDSGAVGNFGVAGMKQKFTLVVSDSNHEWQGVAFFSSYKYDNRCQPKRKGPTLDTLQHDRYQLTQSTFSDDLVCANNKKLEESENPEEPKPITDRQGRQILYREVATDSALFIAVVDSQQGTYTYRVICEGGHKVSAEGYYDISECAIDDLIEEVEHYNPSGKKITSKSDTKKIDDNLKEKVQVVRNQMNDYSRAQQFPAVIAEFARLQGNFSNDGKVVDNAPLETEEYASEQEKETNLSSLPPAPKEIRSAAFADAIHLGWANVEQATYYKLYRDTSDDATAATKIAESEVKEAYDRDFQANTRYFYWVKSCNDDGCSAEFSEATEVTNTVVRSPLTPQNIVAKEITSSSVQLSWGASSNASEYRVYRNTRDVFDYNTETLATRVAVVLNPNPNPNPTTKRVARVVLDSHTEYGLESGTDYYYWIEACNKGACSEESSPFSVKTTPARPTNFHATATKDENSEEVGVILTWNSSTGASEYQIYRNTASDFDIKGLVTTVPVTGVQQDTWEYINGSLAPDIYYYWIRACNETGCSGSDSDSPSPPIRFGEVPNHPMGVSATPRGLSKGIAELTWTNTNTNTNTYTSYRVYRSDTSGPFVTVEPELITTVKQKSHTSGELGLGIYYYWIRACNNLGCSSVSSNLGYYPDLEIEVGVPDHPGGFDAAPLYDDGGVQAVLTWSSSTNTSRYEIYRSRTSTFGDAKLVDDEVEDPDYLDDGVVPGVYYYWIRACNKFGCSSSGSDSRDIAIQVVPGHIIDITEQNSGNSFAASTSLSMNGLEQNFGDSKKSIPTDLKGRQIRGTSLVLSWKAVKNTVSYEILRSEGDHAGIDAAQIISYPSSNSWTDYKVSPGTNYSYWVRACLHVPENCSDYSQPLSLITVSGVPVITSTRSENGSEISVEWGEVQNASNYKIVVDSDIYATKGAAGKEQTTETRVVISELEPSTTYYVRVQSCNSSGCSGVSSPGYTKTSSQTSPRSLAAYSLGSEVVLEWAAPSSGSIDSYAVYRNTTRDANSATLLSDAPAASSYLDEGVPLNTTFYYWVKACTIVECSDFSPNASITTSRYSLNDTGITKGISDDGAVVACSTSANERQDCKQGRDADNFDQTLMKRGGGAVGFDFTRLHYDGAEYDTKRANPSFQRNPWACVQDNQTGLVWEVKHTDESAANYGDLDSSVLDLQSHDAVFQWRGTTAVGEDSDSTLRGEYYNDWNNLVSSINRIGLCGYSDWRVPTLQELVSLAHLGNTDQGIDTNYFPNIDSANGSFWSASAKISEASKADAESGFRKGNLRESSAWQFDFPNQRIVPVSRETKARVRLVRSSTSRVEHQEISNHQSDTQITTDYLLNDWPG